VAVALAGFAVPEARAARLAEPATVAAPPVRPPRGVFGADAFRSAGPPISIVSFNACGAACRRGEVARTAAHIATVARRNHADAVLLQELCYSQFLRLRHLLRVRGYSAQFAPAARSAACARDERRFGTGFGVAVLVRGAVSNAEVLPLPTPPEFERRVLLGVTAPIAGRSTFVAVVHLSPSPRAGLDQQLSVVAHYLSSRVDEPVIIGGDFNALPDKPGLSALYSPDVGGTGRFAEADEWRSGQPARGGAPTFDVAGRKIDYVFLGSPWFQVVRARGIETTLSDHRVYVATARLGRLLP
jgi:endonuclease/exonuclease/phosphatase family metal-dependent hydrolase